MAQQVTYGEGGYNPDLPNNNIVEIVEVPDIVETNVRESALAKLVLLGLTEEEIQALVG